MATSHHEMNNSEPKDTGNRELFWKRKTMMEHQKPRILPCVKYISIRILVFILIHKIITNPYIDSFVYGNLKDLFHKHLKTIIWKNEGHFCLIPNPLFKKPEIPQNICTLCESIHEIRNLYDTSFHEIETLCMHQSIPVIIADAMLDWSELYNINLQNFTEISRLPQIREYTPCYLLTNLNLRSRYLSDYLDIISSSFTSHWFLSWKNCALPEAKTIRLFYQQPYFTKYFLPAPSVNWVLLSNKYNSRNLKKVQTDGRLLLIVMQLRGSLHFELKPIKNCCGTCLSINGTLNESQILTFNAELWQLHYRPHPEGIDISIITENYRN